MGDSDDEYRHRRRSREKFSRERPDVDRHREDRIPRRTHQDSRGGRHDQHESRGYEREEYRSSSMKRQRVEWRSRSNKEEKYFRRSPDLNEKNNHSDDDRFRSSQNNTALIKKVDYETAPPMLSFKQFIQTQDDQEINEVNCGEKFRKYKITFQTPLIKGYFKKHKDEEWLQFKYMPGKCESFLTKQTESIKLRRDVFFRLRENGWMDDLTLDAINEDRISTLLDAAVILMEGGDDFDLYGLPHKFMPACVRDKLVAYVEEAQRLSEQTTSQNGAKKSRGLKIRRLRDASGEDGEMSSGDDAESGALDFDDEIVPYEPHSPDGNPPSNAEDPEVPGMDSKSTASDGAFNNSDEKPVSTSTKNTSKPGEYHTPRALHKITSIFLRNIEVGVPRDEILKFCKSYPGFLRLAVQEPASDRNFMRRGWVTYQGDVDIAPIAKQMDDRKLGKRSPGALPNRELSQRIRLVSAIAAHVTAAQADLKLAAKIVSNMDSKWQLWSSDDENPILKAVDELSKVDVQTLIDAPSAPVGNESPGSDTGSTGGHSSIKRSKTLLEALDTLILYLRIVHSVDYYNAHDYPNEHEMPYLCSICHVRSFVTASTKTITEDDVTSWTQSLEKKLMNLLQEPIVNMTDSKAMGWCDAEVAVQELINTNIVENAVNDTWSCRFCCKKFKGPDFTRKHIRNKHTDELELVRIETLFFNNYVRDPRRPRLPEHPSAHLIAAASINQTGSGGGTSAMSAQGGMPPMMNSAGGPPPMPYPGMPMFPPMMMPGFPNPFMGGPFGGVGPGNMMPGPQMNDGGGRGSSYNRGQVSYRDFDQPELN